MAYRNIANHTIPFKASSVAQLAVKASQRVYCPPPPLPSSWIGVEGRGRQTQTQAQAFLQLFHSFHIWKTCLI